MTKGDLIVVTWLDIEQNNTAWHTEEDMQNALEIEERIYTNVGFYYGENKNYLFVYSGKSPDETYFDFTRMPLGCIKSMKTV